MRDYVLSEAQSRQAFGLVAVARRMVRNWKNHRDLHKLLKLDDYLLRDMGAVSVPAATSGRSAPHHRSGLGEGAGAQDAVRPSPP